VLPQVFDLFVQGDSSLARSQGGLGIGLTLVRRLVELHGGTAAARSKGPGHGSEFEVCLPARPRPDEVDRAGPTRGPGGERLRIVVIEDNRDAREMLRLLLELQGHQVGEAADGPAGVHAAVTSAPDVVLLDIGLPGMDGYQVARRLRSRMGSGVRLVALTGYSDPETRRATAAAGFDAHLVKPVEPAELTRVLATLA
jgi:CheY-like chemotaxis protein